jgi:hypothetical protein
MSDDRSHRTLGALILLATLLAPTLGAQRPIPRRADPAPRSMTRPPTAAPAAAPAVKIAPSPEAERTRGTYRVSVTGFTVAQETYDDPLQLDGKRDEVYVSAEVMELDRARSSVIPVAGEVRSRVFGDVGGAFGGTDGHNGRVRAGSASPQGGLRTGDSYPNAQPWRLNGQPTADMLPLELWRGELVKGDNAVLVTPTLWEFDETDLREAYRGWLAWASSTSRTLSSSDDFEKLVGMIFQGDAPMYIGLADIGFKTSLSLADALGHQGDRPIGMEPTRVDGKQQYTFKPKTVLLTFDTVERALKSSIGGKGPGAITLTFQERDPKLNGNYVMYLLVERVN